MTLVPSKKTGDAEHGMGRSYGVMRAHQRAGSGKPPLLSIVLLSLIAVSGSALLWALRADTVAASGFEEPDAAAVTRYLADGHSLPRWARSAAILQALSAEAQAHGLQLKSPQPAGIGPERATLLTTLRLARALAQGAVAPSSVQADWFIPAPGFDPDRALGELAAVDDPLPRLRALAPPDEEYARLQLALMRYRIIAQDGGWPTLPGGATLKSGDSDGRLRILRQRLSVEGDLAADGLAADGWAADGTFDGRVEQAVRHFQLRHGLTVDGRVGPETLAALNVDAETRYRQIAANLERWRWLPRHLPPYRIMVNAAAARLTLIEDGGASLVLRTVVGAPQHPTPVFAAAIASLLLNPPWDIPASIVAREIRPRARRDPGFLEREGIVTRDGDGQLRQLPGPRNPLGRIKFEMPNPLDIYVHDTPAKALLQRARRFFSHGCIRVDDARGLALALLRRDSGWTAAAFDQAINEDATRRIAIAPSIPVYVTYFTSAVEAGGVVAFYDDVYDRDGRLIAALFPEQVAAVTARAAPVASLGCGAR